MCIKTVRGTEQVEVWNKGYIIEKQRMVSKG